MESDPLLQDVETSKKAYQHSHTIGYDHTVNNQHPTYKTQLHLSIPLNEQIPTQLHSIIHHISLYAKHTP